MILLLLLSWVAFANPVSDGAKAWEATRGPDALSTWRAAAADGVPSGVLLYDLGVAEYRVGDPARAVAYLQAARRLRPRDPQLVHNLARARNRISGAPDPVGAPAGWMEFATPGELGTIALLLLLGAAGGLWWRRLRAPDTLRLPWLVTGAAGLGLAATVGHATWDLVRRPVVVVVDAPATARDSARADAAERFTLPPGSEVRVERVLGPYELVVTGRGDRGWIPRAATLYVGPPSVVSAGSRASG